TTAYILSVTDNKGCPKTVRDTVIVNVLDDIQAFAGRDTSVIIGQPLQLNGSNGAAYGWSPSYGLSATDIRNPIALFQEGSEGIRYKLIVYNAEGCADSAYINIKIFSTKADVFVPTAFTPNGDSRNDVIRPIAVGIKQIEFFRIYNRWGQLVFSTTINGQGWDGRIKGQLQGSNVYVWEVKATDYDGKPFFKKGMVTLIR
ncbi:MAG TPA: T9SS type B sorting domain-containing protein, partial [Flavisolibacter sp.]|nr:T9SS type B sorting domain-containing protein [Flavisolibacter sp.]